MEAQQNEGFTALMLSCQNGHLEVSCPTQTATLALALAHPEPQANAQPSFALSRSLGNCSRQGRTQTLPAMEAQPLLSLRVKTAISTPYVH